MTITCLPSADSAAGPVLGARDARSRETQSLPLDTFTVHGSTEGRGVPCTRVQEKKKKNPPMQVPKAGAQEGAMLRSTNTGHRPVQVRSGWGLVFQQ